LAVAGRIGARRAILVTRGVAAKVRAKDPVRGGGHEPGGERDQKDEGDGAKGHACASEEAAWRAHFSLGAAVFSPIDVTRVNALLGVIGTPVN
jgi:hypothetical protein